MYQLLKFTIPFWALLFLSCNSSKNKQKKPEYIDVASYLKGQLGYLDTVPFAFEKTTLNDSVFSDTVFINKEQVKNIVQPFLTEELEKKNFQNFYKETLFADASINTITFTYEPEIKKELNLQRIDVYVNPETQQIAKLFLVRRNETKDSTLIQQLMWKHNKSCQLTTIIYKTDKQEHVVTEKINWNDVEE
jgi:hypothetical protein